MKALRRLEDAGHYVLPEPTTIHRSGSPRRTSEPVSFPVNVSDRVDDLSEFKLILVTSQEHLGIWNELMINGHPLGAEPLVGRQLRYLIDSPHGWLGGLGFVSATLQLADRDKWIGWDADERQAHLDLVVGMSRFLIRPSVHCYNLASKALAMSMGASARRFRAAVWTKALPDRKFCGYRSIFRYVLQGCELDRSWKDQGTGQAGSLQRMESEQEGDLCTA